MKVGDIIIAIDPCKMDDGEEALTVGEKYRINSIDKVYFTIMNDDLREHFFRNDTFDEFFKLRQWERVKTQRKIISSTKEMLLWQQLES